MCAHFCPYVGKLTGISRIFLRQSVNRRSKMSVEIGSRLDQTVILVDDFSVAHHNNADTAHTTAVAVGSFEVDSHKIFHKAVVFVPGSEEFSRSLHRENKSVVKFISADD